MYIRGLAVAYKIGEAATPAQRGRAEKWCTEQELGLAMWPRDGESLRSAGPADRHGLQQALFLLRAGIARALVVLDITDLAPADLLDVVLAEVEQAGGYVSVVGTSASVSSPDERSLAAIAARTGAVLRATVSPRETEYDDYGRPAIGVWDGEEEKARLAHKLYHDFELTWNQVADLMNADDYWTSTGVPYTGANLTHLLRQNAEAIEETTASRTVAPGDAGVRGRFLAVYQIDGTRGAEPPAQAVDCAARDGRFDHDHVVVFGDPRAQVGGPAEGDGFDPSQRAGLTGVWLLAGTGLLGALWLDRADTLGSPVVRELTYAHLWQGGSAVIVAGDPVDPLGACDDQTALLRRIAREGERLFVALRAHDQCTVLNDRHEPDALVRLVQDLSVRRALSGTAEEPLERVAELLEREAVPTRKRTGRWSASAVREVKMHGRKAFRPLER